MKPTIERILCGELQENAYLVFLPEREDALIIDPGDDDAACLKAVRDCGKRLSHILLTHGHFDHILAAPILRRETGAKICLHEKDAPLLRDARLNAYNPLFCREAFAPFAADEVYSLCAPGDIEVCGMAIRVIPTPGHTPGGVCYHLPEYNALFSGDTLFADGYGRTDLPGGSMAELAQSLKALSRLPGEDAIYPGHGESAPLKSAMAVLGL